LITSDVCTSYVYFSSLYLVRSHNAIYPFLYPLTRNPPLLDISKHDTLLAPIIFSSINGFISFYCFRSNALMIPAELPTNKKLE
jgi:hypothetical protein